MLFLFSRILLALSIVTIVVAVPQALGIKYDKTRHLTPEETANKGRIDAAVTLANTQIDNMRKSVDKVREGDAKATANFHAAFGKKAKIDLVDDTVTALQNGDIRVQLATQDFTEGKKEGDDEPDDRSQPTIALVPWSQMRTGGPWRPNGVQLSPQFHGVGHDALDDAGRAGTLIHEATHALSNTGDDINKSGEIIRVDDNNKSQPSGKNGYSSNHNMHKTLAEVENDKSFTDVRDSVPNMHDNAESYAIFASLCSQPGALRRRDVRLYSRALLAGDHEQLHYLARRNSCKLPPDYFAKKAAAKKAAAAKAVSGGVKPATGSKVAKAARKGASAARHTKSTTSKSLNGAKTSKGGVRTTVKGAKSARLQKKTTAKGSRTALKASEQASKGRSRTVKDTKALTRGAKAPKSNKQRTHALKSSRVSSHTKAAHTVKSPQVHSKTEAAPRRNSPKVGAALPVKPLPAKVAISAIGKKH